MNDLRMNERAWTMAEQCIARAGELRIAVHTLSSGSVVIDAGIGVTGGLGAGIALAELCMGGLGHVTLTSLTIGGEAWPGVQVWTDHPAESCMASQYAGWAINPPEFFAMGSGPLRAKARVERELFGKLALRGGRQSRRTRPRGPDAPDRRRRRMGGKEGGRTQWRAHLRHRSHGEPRRRHPDRGARRRDRAAQDGRDWASMCGE